ncbi:hypothetical protein C8J38_101641 [Rhizobium sp. PP-WC-2G-219]|nr:hypothetical protein C8J38_101641 [Rhizobium sp. PP-WC-2G-219]
MEHPAPFPCFTQNALMVLPMHVVGNTAHARFFRAGLKRVLASPEIMPASGLPDLYAPHMPIRHCTPAIKRCTPYILGI